MTRKPSRKRSKKDGLFDPADILQMRMDHYGKLAKKEMRKGDKGDPELIDEYLKLAQDAAKELGPYRHARAQAGDDEAAKRNCVIRVGGNVEFKNVEEWQFYYDVVMAKVDSESMKTAGMSVNDRMLQILKSYKPDAEGIKAN